MPYPSANFLNLLPLLHPSQDLALQRESQMWLEKRRPPAIGIDDADFRERFGNSRR
jgi:hypothetical protein